MARSAAFFDLDKTVIAKSSVLAFGRPLYQGGLMTRGAVLRGAYAQLVYRIAGADEDQMARMRDYLAKLCEGWPVEQVNQIVAETLHDMIDPYIYAEAAALIEEHHAAGRDVILVSASGEEMVRPIGELLGVDDIIATRMSVADGRYTGEIDRYVAGPVKAEEIVALAKERGYELGDCYAYSDSVTDVPMLQAVGHPTAVNPDRPLRRVATERGWPMVVFRHPVSLQRRFEAFRNGSPLPMATVAVGVGVLVAVGLLWYGRKRRMRLRAAA